MAYNLPKTRIAVAARSTNGAACASASGTGNNGNLLSQTITMPGLSQLTQTYSYDHLNRLTGAQETGGGANWSQTYSYDAFGNRWIVPTQSTGLPALTLETPQSQSWYSTTVPNRIASWNYDGNGNVLQEGSVARSFTYDGENRQVTACLNCTQGSPTATYVYDGEGQRVSKTVSGQTTTYVYDAFGNLAAEYGGDSTSACGTTTCYVTTDHLGSTRLLTSNTGGIGRRYDYEPFGQEIGAGYDGRTTGQGYTATPDDANPKFTGQQRDQETTLDWFNVRYYSGSQGRFQSPDPGNAGADASNPQTWNMYAYVGNNPLSYTDPSGMCPTCLLGLLGDAADGSGVGLAIGAAIGLGELFYDIFGGGGPPPSIPSSLATPSSPILQPSPDFDSQGWNEQTPDSGSGSIDSGTLFGSGNTSPFVFSWQSQSSALGASSASQYVANANTLLIRLRTKAQNFLLKSHIVPNLSIVAPIPGTGPMGYPLLGVQFDATYIATTKQLCGSIGLAFSPTGAAGANFTAFFDPKNAAPNVVPGFSSGLNLQPGPGAGVSATGSYGQPLIMGPTVGTKGVSMNSSYGWCKSF